MPQYFKGDAIELKFYNAAATILDTLSDDKGDFYDGAYDCFSLGDMIYDGEFTPLANAINREIFRELFATLYESFRFAGSFESYLTVFKAIFGDDVDVSFTVPAPGKLEIDIIASGIQEFQLVARRVEDNAYIFDHVVDQDGNNIAIGRIKGFQSQYELEQMLFEMVPDGIFTTITLQLGE